MDGVGTGGRLRVRLRYAVLGGAVSVLTAHLATWRRIGWGLT